MLSAILAFSTEDFHRPGQYPKASADSIVEIDSIFGFKVSAGTSRASNGRSAIDAANGQNLFQNPGHVEPEIIMSMLLAPFTLSRQWHSVVLPKSALLDNQGLDPPRNAVASNTATP